MQTSSLVLEASVGIKKQLLLPIAVSVPLELVPPAQDKSPQTHGVGLVDTGAERSLVCEKILRQIQALPHGETTIIGINGIEKEVDTYLVDLHFIYEEHIAWTIRRLEVAPLENSKTVQVLIGMDVLIDHVKEFNIIDSTAKIHF